jgi:ribonuclease HI
MIDIYIKSGLVSDKPVIAFILKSRKYRWLKTCLVKQKLTKKQIESMGVIYALKHIKPKYYKKKIKLYLDSQYLMTMLAMNGRQYKVNNSSVLITKDLRDFMMRFNNLKIDKMNECEDVEELIHVYKECGLDDIELNEKEDT